MARSWAPHWDTQSGPPPRNYFRLGVADGLLAPTDLLLGVLDHSCTYSPLYLVLSLSSLFFGHLLQCHCRSACTTTHTRQLTPAASST